MHLTVQDKSMLRRGPIVVGYHATASGFAVVLHAGQGQHTKSAHNAHVQCSAHLCRPLQVLGLGAGHRGRAGVTQHTYSLTPHIKPRRNGA